jgi:4-hydroxy-3-methylbut-2-enyl diphosphate reductase
MTIHLAEHYGICFGVRDALALAERLADDEPLTILGQLVHNPIARERLDALGVKQGALDDAPGAPAAATHRVMITAHGSSDAARARWRESGHAVADATCPLVRHAHGQLRRLVEEEGCFPVIIGKHGHVEVLGLAGDFPEAVVLETEADLAAIPERPLYGVVSQTTQPIERVHRLVVALRACRPNSRVRFRDTVCRPTKDRQAALRKLIGEVEIVIVVGGRNSNNTRELVETVRAAGLPAHHIERAEELRPEWFEGIEHAGITGGTSTLPETVAEVQRRLLEMAGQYEEVR